MALRIAISQPTYLPWLGYLDLLAQVDTFVLLDNVQFEKQSWQHRNRIKTPTGLQWLTVPVVYRGHFGQKICDVEIREPDFWRKHLRSIEVNYRRADEFQTYFGRFSQVLKTGYRRLADLNAALLQFFADILQIRTPVVLASSLTASGKRTELLAGICEAVGATEYLSPIGSAAYLVNESEVLTGRGIKVEFQNYTHPEYRQLFSPFVPYACVLDLLLNEGQLARQIIGRGRGIPLTLDVVAGKLAEAQRA